MGDGIGATADSKKSSEKESIILHVLSFYTGHFGALMEDLGRSEMCSIVASLLAVS